MGGLNEKVCKFEWKIKRGNMKFYTSHILKLRYFFCVMSGF